MKTAKLVKKPAILGIIPARGGSKGIPNKNICDLAGHPLLYYTIAAAKQSSLLGKFVVTTDDQPIAAVARDLNCDVIMRPPELAQDDTPTLPVILHTIKYLNSAGQFFDYVVLLQPTCPLRTTKDIDQSLSHLIQSGKNSIVSVTKVPGHFHPDWQFLISDDALSRYNGKPLKDIIPRRQLLTDTFTRNGAIYAVRTQYLLTNESLFDEDTLAYVMPENRSVNIDSEQDLAVAEHLVRTNDK